jgi:hypothetical protein
MFRDVLRERRCVVPIDGYYEWRTTSSGKVPFWFYLKTGEPFFLAGLWDCWHEGKPDALASYILMTTEPNELAAKVHDRMPRHAASHGCGSVAGPDNQGAGSGYRPARSVSGRRDGVTTGVEEGQQSG